MQEYLAIDIGASSGRHIIGKVENGKLAFEEVYRFDNDLKEENGLLTWDIDRLTAEVINGLIACRKAGHTPATVAIDTWGVDYVLLDKDCREIRPVFAYRDARTVGVPEEIDAIIPRRDLYARTGIAPNSINTIYQLYCDKKSGKLDGAAHFLMIPEYLSYRLTGRMVNEYTNASTTGLLDAASGTWDKELLAMLGIPASIFLPLTEPATALGEFSAEIAEQVGFSATVVMAPSHDTASAVAACPIDDSSIYISSGTWSLIGTENRKPVLTEDALQGHFTNEGGVEHRYRFLENIMGMWLFQNIRRNINKSLTYDGMMELAMASTYTRRIDPNDPSFVAPDNMIEAIRTALGEPDLPLGDVLSSVYHSLAYSYDTAVKTVERVCGKKITNILIVGGGSKDVYLNRLTEQVTGKPVRTGLNEATATGNILSQIMYRDGITLDQAREYTKL